MSFVRVAQQLGARAERVSPAFTTTTVWQLPASAVLPSRSRWRHRSVLLLGVDNNARHWIMSPVQWASSGGQETSVQVSVRNPQDCRRRLLSQVCIYVWFSFSFRTACLYTSCWMFCCGDCSSTWSWSSQSSLIFNLLVNSLNQQDIKPWPERLTLVAVAPRSF